MKSDILKIESEGGSKGMWVPVGPKYHFILKEWWDYFGLSGVGLTIGEGEIWASTRAKMKGIYPKIDAILSVDLYEEADIRWDITKPFDKNSYGDMEVDWIICQAVLEHVVDPACAIKNMSDMLIEGGMLYIHTHGPMAEYHAYPIDCFRFFKDAFIAFAKKFNLEIADILCNSMHCFVAYKKW